MRLHFFFGYVGCQGAIVKTGKVGSCGLCNFSLF